MIISFGNFKGAVLTSILCFVSHFFSWSQENFINYRIQDGLPSNQVYQVHQDHNGLIWLATDRGISSFNGSYFTTYTEKDGLPHDVVFRFFPQENGQIWCATKSKALFYFHPDTLKFHVFNDGSYLEDVAGIQIRGLKIDEQGTVRLRLIESTGFIEIPRKGKAKKHFVEKIEGDSIDPYPANYSYSLDQKDGYTYYHPDSELGSEIQNLTRLARDIFVFDGSTYARTALNEIQIHHKNGDSVHYQLNTLPNDLGFTNNNIWIGTRSGIEIIDRSGKLKDHWLDEIDCSYYFEDVNHGKWFTTLSEGIYYRPPTPIKSVDQFNGFHIHSLGVSKSNNLIVGRYDFQFHYLDQNLRTNAQESVSNRPVSDYFKIGGQVGNEHVTGMFIRKLSDRKDAPAIKIWRTSIDIKKGDDQKKLSIPVTKIYDSEFIKDRIVLSADKSLFIANYQGEILKESETGVVIHDIDVFENLIYCGIKGKGIKIFNSELSCIDSIFAPELEHAGRINELVVGVNGIWVGAMEGLSRLSWREGAWKVNRIGKTNGLLANEVEDLLLKNDTLFVATRNGLNYFKVNDWKDIIHAKNHTFFHIKKFTVNDSVYPALTNLSHYENRIQVEYAFATYPVSSNLIFKYRLKGLEEDWNYTKDRTITYKSLPPGKYEMLIQPQIDNLEAGDALSIPINIKQAFYKTWWFIIGLILVFTTIIWLFFKYRILAYNRELIREILRNLIKRLKPKTQNFTVRSNGYDVKINSADVLYVESNGNYINIHTSEKRIVVRQKLSKFKELVPDPLEYLQIRRSVIIRLDQVTSKSIDNVQVGEREFKVGNTYLKQLSKIQL